jgi:YLP motif-containing protein 1
LIDKLDGLRMNKKKKDSGPQRLQDYLQLPDDYESRTSQPGKKRVRQNIADLLFLRSV